jgi:tryptophan synthase alpha chain
MGVTGARQELPKDLPEVMKKVRALTELPIAVGFGISTPKQVRQVAGVADGAVVESALVEFAKTGTPEQLRDFVKSLKAACRSDWRENSQETGRNAV